MKRVWIPVLFVVCGAFASCAWRTIELPCEVPKLEIASTVVSPLLRCAVSELVRREVSLSEVNSEINSVGVSISAWLVRHRVGRAMIGQKGEGE